jgi:hypothetical protein
VGPARRDLVAASNRNGKGAKPARVDGTRSRARVFWMEREPRTIGLVEGRGRPAYREASKQGEGRVMTRVKSTQIIPIIIIRLRMVSNSVSVVSLSCFRNVACRVNIRPRSRELGPIPPSSRVSGGARTRRHLLARSWAGVQCAGRACPSRAPSGRAFASELRRRDSIFR